MTIILIDPPMPQPQPGNPFPPPWPGGPRHNQQATCPTCADPVPGLLACCDKPLCRTADLAYDVALNRRADR